MRFASFVLMAFIRNEDRGLVSLFVLQVPTNDLRQPVGSLRISRAARGTNQLTLAVRQYMRLP